MNNSKALITTVGKGKPIVGIVGGMHGNESTAKIVRKLEKEIVPKKGTILFIIANPEALKKKVRFIDTDLNRVFPGKADGNFEEQLAYQLIEIGKKCDYLIDLHSCSMESKPFCIVRNDDGPQMELAKTTGLENIVIYPTSIQKGSSFIDHVPCGVGIELGLHDKEETFLAGYQAVLRLISRLGMIGTIAEKKMGIASIFLVTDHLLNSSAFKPNNDIHNFQLVKKGEILGVNKRSAMKAKKDFYPIMYNQTSYKAILCWMSEKVV